MDNPLEVYETLPIVPLRDVVVFPHMMMPFVIGRPSSTRALEHALLKDKRIFLAAQHDASVDDPQPEDIYSAHRSLLHPGHRRSICAEQALPPDRCALAISARALMKTGLPLRLSTRFTVVSWPESGMTS